MAGLRGSTAIVGVGETAVGHLPGRDSFDLACEVAKKAAEDAGLTLGQIDGLLCGGSLVDDMYMYAARLAARLGIAPAYSSVLPIGGSAFCHAIIEAELIIRAGLASNVLVVAADYLLSGLGPRESVDRFEAFQDASTERPYGFTMPAIYAMAARRHMHLFGTTREQLAQVAVSARRHASLNPLAHYRKPLSLSDVVSAPVVADPLGVFDCSPISDGGGAFIVAAGERADAGPSQPVYVLAAAEGHVLEYSHPLREITNSATASAGRDAFLAAGLKPDDVDFAELYDCFTITTIITIEDLGFCSKGEGGLFVESGRIELGGVLPVNTHGGLLSHGHPGASAGIFHIIEAVKQIRRTVPPERQVPTCSVGLVSGNSGMLRDMAVVLLGKERNA